MNTLRFYRKLFMTTFKLSAFTFGGGYVIVSLMKKEFVDKLNWITEREMLDFTTLAQSSPGPIAVNASNLIGYKLSGIRGSIVALAGTVTPPLIIISIISFFYEAFSANMIVQHLLLGMQGGVAAILLDVIYSMSFKMFKNRKYISITLMLISFVLVFFFNVNVLFIIVCSGLIGILVCKTRKDLIL